MTSVDFYDQTNSRFFLWVIFLIKHLLGLFSTFSEQCQHDYTFLLAQQLNTRVMKKVIVLFDDVGLKTAEISMLRFVKKLLFSYCTYDLTVLGIQISPYWCKIWLNNVLTVSLPVSIHFKPLYKMSCHVVIYLFLGTLRKNLNNFCFITAIFKQSL